MKKVDILELKETILENNDADADLLREQLKKQKTFYLNVMSSPGSGKTSVLLKTLEGLKNNYRVGVMEADIDSDVDALKIADAGFPSIQLHTGGMCHLDADMSRQGLRKIGVNIPEDTETETEKSETTEHLDAVILENVGNLVCPAEFDTGAVRNVVILSVPEGDDKPAKYPLIFQKCEVVLVNKIDTLPVFDFDFERLKKDIYALNPNAVILPLSAITGEGVENWCEWLAAEIDKWNK
ncbi:MAG: hydrogenase nickel incorporation protein HypB [Eubacteriales bacterium]|nr:hydrogenase nickel incorporation protein HypB [Eubacteriales bacterium]